MSPDPKAKGMTNEMHAELIAVIGMAMQTDTNPVPGSCFGMSPSEFWQAAHEQSGQRLHRPIDDEAEEAFWRDYADGYDQKSPLAACSTELIADVQASLGAKWHMVEIGAGSGAFTRRLAPMLSRITIVEPSAAMRAEFQRLWDGAVAVDTMGSKWEDAPSMDADFVFGANAFYRIRNIAAALLKMNDIARHRVALVQTIGRPHANPLTLTVDGRTCERERANALCDVLGQLGIGYQRRDYRIARPDGPGMAALIDWVPNRSQ